MTTKLLKIIKYFWKSLLIVSSISYLSFASPSTFKEIPTFENEDKLVHLLMYFGLSAVLIFDFRRTGINNRNLLAFVLVCLIFPVVLGGSIELIQENFFHPRTASWFDWIADIAGVLLGWLAMSVIKSFKEIK